MGQHKICSGLFIKHLNVSGWRYIVEHNDLSKFQILLSYLPTIIGVSIMLPYIICQIVSFFCKAYDFPGATEIVCIVIPLILVEIKMLTFLLNIGHFRELFSLFSLNIFEFVNLNQRDKAMMILQKQVNKINKCLLIFVCTNFIPHLAWQLVPLFELFGLAPVNNSSESVTKIIPGWYPLDLTSYTVYSLVFAYESVLLTFCGFYMTAGNALLLQLILMLCAHISVLAENFRDIGKYTIDRANSFNSVEKRRSTNRNMISSVGGHKHEEYKFAARCLTVSIENHQVVLKLAKQLRTVYSIFVAAEFISGLFVICILLFQVTIISLNLNHGIYESNWYCLQTKNAKKISTVLQISQNVLSITVGFTYRANLELFSATMRVTYSFYTVLVNVYGQKQ